jgi:hypothetical protein
MILWLDDIREPWKFGFGGSEWVKTADDAIALLKTGAVTFASLDHDLSEEATLGTPKPGEKTGYTVVLFMEENDIWPEKGVRVHSLNPAGKAKMEAAILRHYGRNFR